LQTIPNDGKTEVEVYPGTFGGVETPFAFAEGVVFAPIVNFSTTYFATEIDAASLDFSKGTGELVALDGATGKILWDIQLPAPAYGAATVVNDVVFTAGLDAIVRAFSTKDGSALWSWQAPAGVNAPLAASGDFLYVPAGGPIYASKDTKNPGKPSANLVALTIGGTATISGLATPESGAASPAAAATPAAAASGGTAFAVSTIDLVFDPKTLTIPANTDVKITVTNKGVLQHDFTIDELKVHSKLLNGGDSDTVTINAAAGSYQYYCSVPGHKEAGMVGTLTVK
ncbi:MAG TPA: cupredoxin domain-containing protein, partial [Thermomicrobiales bacterium]|nr:cupredoxin domain-containing protein [Thermomicrobiales bacterium]